MFPVERTEWDTEIWQEADLIGTRITNNEHAWSETLVPVSEVREESNTTHP